MAKASKSTPKVVVVKKKATKAKKSPASGAKKGTAATRIMEAIASQMAIGLVMYDSKTVWLTEKGLETVGPDAVARPQSNDAMQEKMKESIKGAKPKEIFGLLRDGKAYSRPQLAEMMGLENNKRFGTYISALSKVVERVDKKIRLIDMAFPLGRPCDN